MTNDECEDELRDRLREIERKMENIERIGRIHTEGWMKLMK